MVKFFIIFVAEIFSFFFLNFQFPKRCITRFFRHESEKCAELFGKLKQAFEKIDDLTNEKDDLTLSLSELKIRLRHKTNLGFQATDTIKVDFRVYFMFVSSWGQDIWEQLIRRYTHY